MATAALHCQVITPEHQVVDAKASSVIMPAHDGMIGIMRNRAPLVCELGIGVLTIETADAGKREFYIDGGFAQVINNEVSILTDHAEPAEQIKHSATHEELVKAEQMKAPDAAAFEARQKALARARTRVKLARAYP